MATHKWIDLARAVAEDAGTSRSDSEQGSARPMSRFTVSPPP